MTKIKVFKDGTVWISKWDDMDIRFATFEKALKHALAWRKTYFEMYGK